jgi:hypothetical protein
VDFCGLTPSVSYGRCMILIEEFETSFEKAVSEFSPGGESNLSRLYNLLDGSSALQGCVVVLTANSIPDALRRRYAPFFRVGRIDTVVRFPSHVPVERIQEAIECKFSRVNADLCAAAVAEAPAVARFSPSEIVEFVRTVEQEWESRSEGTPVETVIRNARETLEQEKASRAVDSK